MLCISLPCLSTSHVSCWPLVTPFETVQLGQTVANMSIDYLWVEAKLVTLFCAAISGAFVLKPLKFMLPTWISYPCDRINVKICTELQSFTTNVLALIIQCMRQRDRAVLDLTASPTMTERARSF